MECYEQAQAGHVEVSQCPPTSTCPWRTGGPRLVVNAGCREGSSPHASEEGWSEEIQTGQGLKPRGLQRPGRSCK